MTTKKQLIFLCGFQFIKEHSVEVAQADPRSIFISGKNVRATLFSRARANVCFIQFELLICLLLTIHSRDEMQLVTSVCGERNQFTPLVHAQNGTTK